MKVSDRGAIEVDAPFSQLTGEKIVIDRVELRDLTIELEKGADGKLHQKNLGKIDQVKDPCKANKVGPCASGS